MASIRSILRGANVVLGDPLDKRTGQVDIRVDGGLITEIGTDLDQHSEFEILDLTDQWIVPGFVDGHQHLWQSVIRGLLADCLHPESALIVKKLVGNVLTPEDVYASTFGGAVSQLEAGVTCTLDHCDAVRSLEHGRAAVSALDASGLRAVWCHGFDSIDPVPTHLASDAHALAAHVRSATSGLLSFGVAPNDASDLADFADQVHLGQALESLILTHTDTKHGQIPGGNVSEKWLTAGLLGDRHVHAHCTSTPAAMFAAFADLGCSVVCSPDLELASGLGYTALRQASDAGVTVGLSAGSPAVTSADMFATMRMGLQSERGRYQQLAAEASGTSSIGQITMRTEEVLHFATLGAAQAIGLGDICGSIEVGKAADLVTVSTNSPRLRPIVDPIAGVVLHMSVADIDSVLVAGEFRKRGGRMIDGLDSAAIHQLDAAFERISAAYQSQSGQSLAATPTMAIGASMAQ